MQFLIFKYNYLFFRNSKFLEKSLQKNPFNNNIYRATNEEYKTSIDHQNISSMPIY